MDLGKCEEGDWLKSVKPVLDKRMQRCVCVCVTGHYKWRKMSALLARGWVGQFRLNVVTVFITD